MRIASIVKDPKIKPVYDIQVPGVGHYVANGLVSHNSALASQLAKFWASIGEKVFLVPLEMSKQEQTGRLLANIAKVDVRNILLHRLTESEKDHVETRTRKFIRSAKAKGGRYTIYKPNEDMTIEEIMAVASTYGPKVVIIDYISLLKGVDDENQWLKLGAIARFCKIYASNNNMIVVLLAQLSDEGKIRYAQAIREHADYAWIFVATKESIENQVINVEQLKGRNVERFPFSLRAELKYMRIGDLNREDHPQSSKDSAKAKSGKKTSQETKPAVKDKYLSDVSEE
jgi:hypothetical protein